MNKFVTWLLWLFIMTAGATGFLMYIRDCGVKVMRPEHFEPGLPPP